MKNYYMSRYQIAYILNKTDSAIRQHIWKWQREGVDIETKKEETGYHNLLVNYLDIPKYYRLQHENKKRLQEVLREINEK